MFQTHSYSMTRKSHYINNTLVLLMLASTIRFSNHYQTPPTTTPLSMAARGTGRSHWLKPHPTLLGFVIPGPNNVPVPAHPTPTPRGQKPQPGSIDEQAVVMFHP